MTYIQGAVPWVSPDNHGNPQGVSVAPDTGCNLPKHRRPPGAPWNGTGSKNLIIWQIDSASFTPNQLGYAADPTNTSHGFISPGIAMPLSQYRGYVIGTAATWTRAADPDPACTVTKGEKVSATDERADRIDATAAGEDVDSMIEELRAANSAGVGRDTIIAELEEGVTRAEQAGNEEGAEILRTLLDRITGFSGPHARIDLE